MSSTVIGERSPTAGGADLDDLDCALAGRDLVGLLDVTERALRRLRAQVLGGGIDDDALTDSVAGLQRLETMAFAEKLRRVAAVDERGGCVSQGVRTTADLLAARCGLTRGEAAAQVDTALALVRMPETAAKLADGRLSAGQAQVAARTLRDLEAAAQAEALAQAEAEQARAAAEQAERASAADGEDSNRGPDGETGGGGGLWSVDGGDRVEGGWSAGSNTAAARAAAGLDGAVAGSGARDRNQLRRDLDAWAQRHGVDRLAVNERAVYANRRLWVGATADGVIGIEGRLPTIGGVHVVAEIDALARPAGDGDTRTFAQRRADALVTLAVRSLAGQTLNPHAGEDTAHGEDTSHGGSPYGGSRQSGAGHGGAGQGGARETGAGDPGTTPGGTGRGGVPPAQVLLITTVDALHDTPGAEPSLLDGVGAVSNATARQVCCDAHVTTVTVDRDGTVLDVGRTRRTPTARQRAAVIARDRGCVGCGAAVAQCQIHHIRWWTNGGPTDLDNLCLVCWNCHHHIHQHHWHVQADDPGGFTITRTSDHRQPG